MSEAFSPDGKQLLLPASSARVLLFDTGASLPRSVLALRSPATALAWDPKGQQWASGDAKGQLQRWNAEGKPVDQPIEQRAGLRALVWPQPDRLFSVTDDGQVWRISLASDAPQVDPLEGHDAAVDLLRVAPSGRLLLSADEKGGVWLRDANSGKPLHRQADLRHERGLRDAGFAPDERSLWTLDTEGRGRQWDVASGKLQAETEPELAALAVLDKTLVGWRPGQLLRWGVDRQSPDRSEAPELPGEPAFLMANPEGNILLLGSHRGGVIALNADLKPLWDAPQRLDIELADLIVSPDGRLLLARDRSAARLFDLRSGRLHGPVMGLTEQAPAPPPAPIELDAVTLTRIGNERVLRVNGVTGLFTPLSSADPTLPIGSDERRNLQQLIDQLRRELSEQQSRSLQLQAQLDTLRERPAAPDDFATGVQQSLDEMQQRLLAMRNPSSNFAVREFKLEASVYVQVSPLGNIEYRFVQPGERVEPASLSRLSLQLVPLPKTNLAGVWTPDLFQPELPLATLPEISAAQAELMERQGLYAVGEFLQVGTRARVQLQLAALLGVERLQLQRWAQQALLLSLRGMNGRAAQLLIRIGLDRFESLAALAPAALVQAFEAARDGDPQTPALDEALAAQWIRAVRQYLGLPELDSP